MSIKRAPRPESNFYLLDKSISEDKRLSWAARGLLVFLLGKPDHWEVSVTHLIKQTDNAGKRSGRDAVRALINELMDCGYVKRVTARKERGEFGGYDYVVSEIPSSEPKAESPKAESPGPDSPETDNPAPANPPQVSTEYLVSTDLSNSCPKGLVAADAGSEETKIVPPRKIPCPAVDIVNLYHELLPELTEVKELTDSRRKALQARWNGNPNRQSLDFWTRYFGYVRKSPFLMGQIEGHNGRQWRADFEWLVKAGNFAKVIEGKYHD